MGGSLVTLIVLTLVAKVSCSLAELENLMIKQH